MFLALPSITIVLIALVKMDQFFVSLRGTNSSSYEYG